MKTRLERSSAKAGSTATGTDSVKAVKARLESSVMPRLIPSHPRLESSGKAGSNATEIVKARLERSSAKAGSTSTGTDSVKAVKARLESSAMPRLISSQG